MRTELAWSKNIQESGTRNARRIISARTSVFHELSRQGRGRPSLVRRSLGNEGSIGGEGATGSTIGLVVCVLPPSADLSVPKQRGRVRTEDPVCLLQQGLTRRHRRSESMRRVHPPAGWELGTGARWRPVRSWPRQGRFGSDGAVRAWGQRPAVQVGALLFRQCLSNCRTVC